MKCEYCGRTCLPGEVTCGGCGAPIENPIPVPEIRQTQGSNIEVNVGGINIKINGPTSTTMGGTVGGITSTTTVDSMPNSVTNDIKNTAVNPILPVGYETRRQRKQREVAERYRLQREQEELRKSQAMEASQDLKYVRGIFAGFFSRTIAFGIDFIVLAILWGIIGEPIEKIFNRDVLALMMSIYFVGLEVFAKGATLGKRAMKIRVVNAKGESITLLQGILRCFSKLLSLAFFFIGFIMIGLSAQKQGLHDCIANTYVIKDR